MTEGLRAKVKRIIYNWFWICPALDGASLEHAALLERHDDTVERHAVGVEVRRDVDGRVVSAFVKCDVHAGRDTCAQDVHGKREVTFLVLLQVIS